MLSNVNPHGPSIICTTHDRIQDFCIEKPGKPKLSGFDAPECAVEMWLSLWELRSTTCGLETVLTYPWSKKSSIYAGFWASSSENPYWTESQPPLYLTREAGIRHHRERNIPRRNPKTTSSHDACDFRLKGAGIANHPSLYLPQPSNQINFHS